MKNRIVDDQTKTTERNGLWESASTGFARGVGNFTHDILTLAELQAQLLAADVQECRQRLLVPALLLFCGVAVSLACFPIALTALALFLVQQFSMSLPAGFLMAFMVGAVFGALLSVVGWRQVGKKLAVLRRSQHENADGRVGLSNSIMSATEDINVFAIPGFREPVNSFSHLLAVIAFSILSFHLVRQGRGSWLRTASLASWRFRPYSCFP